MKSTGIMKKVDNVGRISIPKVIREALDVEIGAPMSVSVDGNKIIIEKYQVSDERNERFSVLANLQTLLELEKNPNVKDTLVRAIELIK
jgi:transcriptional pleiotropic regulator of transition state genes